MTTEKKQQIVHVLKETGIIIGLFLVTYGIVYGIGQVWLS